MRKTIGIGILCLSASVAAGACGSSGGTTTGTQGTGDQGTGGATSTTTSSTTTGSTTTGSTTTSSTTTSSSSSGSGGSGCGGSTPVELTVLNYDTWCSVSIAGGTASTAAMVTACVADGPVTLDATAANSTFQIGDWYGTTGDTGQGDPGTVTGSGVTAQSQAMYTASGTKGCVSVCCPFVGGSGCPTPGMQCP